MTSSNMSHRITKRKSTSPLRSPRPARRPFITETLIDEEVRKEPTSPALLGPTTAPSAILGARPPAINLTAPTIFPPLWSPDTLDLPHPTALLPPGAATPTTPTHPILPIRSTTTALLTVEFNANQTRSLLSLDAATLLNALPTPFSSMPSLHGPTVKIWVHQVPLNVSVLPDLGGIVRPRYLMLARPAIEQIKCLLYLVKDDETRDMLSTLVEAALARKGWGRSGYIGSGLAGHSMTIRTSLKAENGS